MKPPATKGVKNAPIPSQTPGSGKSGNKCQVIDAEGLVQYLCALWLKLKLILRSVSVEPVMFLDGIGFAVMIVFTENLQMDKICQVNLNFTEEVCNNISHHPEQNLQLQKDFSVFGMYNGIIMSFLPLFFILFMGAWSDKYGRKVPIIISTVGHLFWSLGYLVNSLMPTWPVEFILLAALCDSLGGGNVSFVTTTNAYLSDVTSEESRTSRVGLANSIWFLGGPIGTLIGTYIYKYGGYTVLFSTATAIHVVSLTILVFLPESHGPFVKKKKVKAAQEPEDTPQTTAVKESTKEDTSQITIWKMFKDFFSYDRIVDSFRCTFKARGGLLRVFILLLIVCSLLRRLGRGAYMYLFTRRVLGWRATDYGLWVTYKNFLAALGSLVMVPLLSTGFGLSDSVLAILGASASVIDYILYGLVSEESYFLVWIAPTVALLVNSCTIAIRSMLSKFVSGDELGKVSAVMGALDGVMPMISFSLYTSVYHATVHSFPGAQFFFGASANLLMSLIFIFIIMVSTSKGYGIDDINTPEGTKSVQPKSLRLFNDNFMSPDTQIAQKETDSFDNKRSDNKNFDVVRSNAILGSVNFNLNTPIQKKKIINAGNERTILNSDICNGRDIAKLNIEVQDQKTSCKINNDISDIEKEDLINNIQSDVSYTSIYKEKHQKEINHSKSGLDNHAFVTDEKLHLDTNEGQMKVVYGTLSHN